MSIFIKIKEPNLIHVQSAAYSWAMHNIRRATDAMILQQDVFTSQWSYISRKLNASFKSQVPILLFRGR
jgi:hypothetical protein